MTDRHVDVTTTGYGGRIIKSIKGVIVGLGLFVGSFGLLYWNEGRVDLSDIAKLATEMSSTTINTDSTLNKKLISTTENIHSDQMIGDNFFLKPGNFIAVERKVEMYSWVEHSKTSSKKNTGGSETTETTYTYSKDWEENPKSSSEFKYSEGHENPQKSLDSYTKKVTTAQIGVYNFDAKSVSLPKFSKLPLNAQNIVLRNGAVLANDSYIFIKNSADGTFRKPQIGDLRISYHVLHSGFEGTVFGKLRGSKIDPYFDQDGNKLYRLFMGTREQAIVNLHTEYKTEIWFYRLVGFLLMWFALQVLLRPISILLDFLPIFGALSRTIIGGMTFLVALLLTSVTIIIAMIAHSFIASIIVLAITIGAIIAFLMKWKNRQKRKENFA